MAKGVFYRCTQCGKKYPGAQFGACGKCGAFQQFEKVEAGDESAQKRVSGRSGLKSAAAVKPVRKAQSLKELSTQPVRRVRTGIGELDRVLGGGFVNGEVVLLSGAPGGGKSTLTLSVSNSFASNGSKVLYSSGEESEQQIGLRAKRMGIDNDNIRVINETNLETLLGHIDEESPDVVVVDSLQTIASTEISGSVGSVQQSKEAAHTLTRVAKSKNIIMVLISQVVKSGDFSGSESIQHIVDATLMLESSPDTPLKFLRAVKNRFGDTTEVGVFQHTESGLEEVADPSGVLMDSDEDSAGLSGTALSFMSEGVRQIPVEIQALVTPSNLPTPRKQFNGVNYNRGQIVCAILDRFCKARLFDKDTFINTVSGIKVSDPLSDLAVAAAVLSSINDSTTSLKTAFVGELSLTGQVRGSYMIDARIREAERLGFEQIVIPKSAMRSVSKNHDIRIKGISSVRELAGMYQKKSSK